MRKSFINYILSSFFVFMFISFFIPSTIFGVVPDYNGGVHNEYTYEEFVFISGSPIRFTGQANITEQESNNKITKTYRFNLTDPWNSDNKLTRNMTYVTDLSERKEKGQTTAQTNVTNYSETITIDDVTYTLDDLQFSHGTVIDNRPASDYYSGNIVARKIYKTDDDKNVTIHVSGKVVGYSNFWGSTETQILDFEIQGGTGNNTSNNAVVRSKVSNSKNKFLQYEKHDPSLSSFTGGYAVISQQDMIGEYTFKPAGGSSSNHHVSQKMTPKVERLIVPKFRDLSGHWARDNIERLYSLGVLDEASQFFSPDTPMTRYQFTTGVIKAADIRVELEENNKKTTNNNNRNVPTSTRQQPRGIFSDLDPRDENYQYVVSAVQKGIIEGVNSSQFRPNDSLTRAQAVTILVRALGLENRAPTPGFRTNYADNNRIPHWAMDSVYVATEIGLVRGDQQNRFNPNQPMSRGEAATMIIRFLDFLEKDLKQNYRDDMLFFN